MDMRQLIKDICYKSDHNQVSLAKILDCPQTSISRFKRNLQFPDTILLIKFIKLAKKYGINVKIEDLLPDK